MTEFEGGLPAAGQELQERLEAGHILLQVRRKLKERGAQSLAERRGDAKEIAEILRCALEPVLMGDALGRLEGEAEAGRDLFGPRQEHALAGHPIKRVVDFDRGEAARVEPEQALVREGGRIEASFPFLSLKA